MADRSTLQSHTFTLPEIEARDVHNTIAKSTLFMLHYSQHAYLLELQQEIYHTQKFLVCSFLYDNKSTVL